MKKKLVAAFACVVIVFSVLLSSSFASGDSDFIFTVIENRVMSPITAETMTFYENGSYYVYYEYFDKVDGVKSFYNDTMQMVLVYGTRRIMYFDLANDTAYSGDITYKKTAVRKNDYIFLPLDIVASGFGLVTSKFTDTTQIPATMIRVSASSFNDISSQAFVTSQKDYMTGLYNEYYAAPEPPATQPPAPPPPKLVYLMFNGTITPNVESLLYTLGLNDVQMAFFIKKDDIVDHGDLLRRLYCEGHTIGIALSGPWDDTEAAVDEFNEANRLLKSVIFTKTRLISISGAGDKGDEIADAFVDEGCRIWGATITPDYSDGSTANIMRRIRTSLSKSRGSAVINIDMSDGADKVMPSLLEHLLSGNYSIPLINQWNTPINQFGSHR